MLIDEIRIHANQLDVDTPSPEHLAMAVHRHLDRSSPGSIADLVNYSRASCSEL